VVRVAEEEWRPLLRALADRLTPDPLAEAAWREVFERIPRHVFVPGFYGEQNSSDEPEWLDSSDPRWLTGVYSDQALTTHVQQHPGAPGVWWPTSSSSRPSLMLRMLHALALTEGMQVLEVGTGSGYNAALLASRLGDRQVVSIDIAPDLVERARSRLAEIGLAPCLAAVDGTAGYPQQAPYDRVIATHSVERIPYAWVAQTRPGGTILADIRSVGAPRVGHLARLTVHADGTASGDFDCAEPGFFMPCRHDLSVPPQRLPLARDLRDARTRATHLSAAVLREPGAAFTVWARLPEVGILFGQETLLFTPEGSWAAAGDDTGQVQVAGSHDLWKTVEEAYAAWHDAGRPDPRRFRIVVTEHEQRILLP
jgi:protein-L-isoaspartate O-methyltransferase